MTDPVAKQLAGAASQLKTADRERAKDSKRRLGEIMAMKPDKQFAHLDDDGLTSSDKRRLRQHIARTLPTQPPSSNWTGPRHIARAITMVGWRLFLSLIGPARLVIIAVFGLWLYLGWQHTWSVVRVYPGESLNFIGPTGFESIEISRETEFPIDNPNSRHGTIRQWIEKRGYMFGQH